MDYKIDKQGRYYIDNYIAGKRCHLRADTKRDLDKKLKAWMNEQVEAQNERDLGPMFETVANAWWEDVQSRVKRGTITCYHPRYEDALSRFSGYRIKEIDAVDITEFFKWMKRQGKAQKTVSNAKIVLSQIWQYWIDSPEWRGDRNPVTLSRVPTGLSKEERQPPSDDAIEKVKAAPDGFGLLANLVLYTGIRLGEANAIQVKDIDFNKDVYGIHGGIRIDKAYPWRGNQPYLESTKTAAGVRWVPIFEPLLPLLKQATSTLTEEDYLISGTENPLTKMQFQRRWQSYCRSLGLAHSVEKPLRKNGKVYKRTEWIADVTPHQFRHYLATMCYEAQVPEMVAQKILGHADIQTTHKVYTHIRDRMLSESAANLNKLFTQKSPIS